MSVAYKVVSKKPGGWAAEHTTKRYYPVLTKRRTLDIRDVCERITTRSVLSSVEVVGVVRALVDLLPELIQNGYNVKLGDLGTFSLHAKATGRDRPEQVTSRDITSVKMSFLPGTEVKRQLKSTEFEKVQVRKKRKT